MTEQKNGPFEPASGACIEKWQVQVDYGEKIVVGPILRDELGQILARLAASETALLTIKAYLDLAHKSLCQALALMPVNSDLPVRYETARDVCLRILPEDADRLFPPGVAS